MHISCFVQDHRTLVLATRIIRSKGKSKLRRTASFLVKRLNRGSDTKGTPHRERHAGQRGKGQQVTILWTFT